MADSGKDHKNRIASLHKIAKLLNKPIEYLYQSDNLIDQFRIMIQLWDALPSENDRSAIICIMAERIKRNT
jgi:hypothetical protein